MLDTMEKLKSPLVQSLWNLVSNFVHFFPLAYYLPISYTMVKKIKNPREVRSRYLQYLERTFLRFLEIVPSEWQFGK